MDKKCTNCADMIVCWGFDEPNNEKAKDCPDWHIDFMTYQELYEKNPPETQC